MKIIITEKQNVLLNESNLRSYLDGVKYIPGETVPYKFIRRIGSYLTNKDFIDGRIAWVVNVELARHRKNFDDDTIREFVLDVLGSVSDDVMGYYEDNWSSEHEDNELQEKFHQIYEFLFETYSDIIFNYIYDKFA
jgi:hypothetical protein